ncbi:uncharacterized protein (DUF305 family) [Kribbella amoyensis]|uniref:Uncharacterized protein (DUF305 family) n=1 Tax=Kribbella amoyensis TaxID=996641 RepID=A0A561BSC1_9ACTN|nr:DUF305 domain-containing protein [Kribbella amoyensis]TWD81682.1 uncharacterized protein (DUF305 family) [Kribbella amoyensis]
MRQNLWKTAAFIAFTGLVLAGCGGNDSGSMPGTDHSQPSSSQTSASAQAGDFNDADVTFASRMIPHHQQAVQMADMAIRKATTPEVKKLAGAIKAAQDPEIKTMSGWLTAWGKPVPAQSHGGHSAEEMPGMMTDDEMSDLGNAKDGMFDRMWTEMMIKHHLGAVAMAKAEQTGGKNAGATALAKKVEADQNREIATMRRLLRRLPAN